MFFVLAAAARGLAGELRLVRQEPVHELQVAVQRPVVVLLLLLQALLRDGSCAVFSCTS